MSEWLYQGREVTDEDLEGYKAFVYVITNIDTKKQYFGKKKLEFTRRMKVKDRKNRKVVRKESDWRDYYGSSEELARDIVSNGKENFTRQILKLCETGAVASYWELYYQMINHVLLNPANYYNNYVGARIHRKHVLGKSK